MQAKKFKDYFMTSQFILFFKKILTFIKTALIIIFGRVLLRLLLMTCRVKIVGLDDFIETASNNRCMIMLWHNRLAIVPQILSRYTSKFSFAAVISASRDGKLLEAIVKSYKRGFTIRVGHLKRYQALKELIRTIEERKHIVIITPDGPRGPVYEMKPGIAIAALETGAQVIALDWRAKRMWELKTWDKLRFPKPFTEITVTFKKCPDIAQVPGQSLEDALATLKESLNV